MNLMNQFALFLSRMRNSASSLNPMNIISAAKQRHRPHAGSWNPPLGGKGCRKIRRVMLGKTEFSAAKG